MHDHDWSRWKTKAGQNANLVKSAKISQNTAKSGHQKRKASRRSEEPGTRSEVLLEAGNLARKNSPQWAGGASFKCQ